MGEVKPMQGTTVYHGNMRFQVPGITQHNMFTEIRLCYPNRGRDPGAERVHAHLYITVA